MRISYTNIDFCDLRGDLIADYLIAVDADLRIMEGDRTIYEEPDFPVVELARSLLGWLDTMGPGTFEFVSLSADESGLVTISPESGGWRLYSSFTPDVRSSVLQWPALAECVRVHSGVGVTCGVLGRIV
ncbi:MAG: hypothetical protein QG608_2145 [Actinomycetota bacterium]|nr:hypothetical protein [Actinomycetota bacterium]